MGMGEYGWAIGVAIIILAVSAGRALRALGQAAARRSARAASPDDAPAAQLHLEVDELRQRLTELEERVDFTERLLAKRRDGERLAPPQ